MKKNDHYRIPIQFGIRRKWLLIMKNFLILFLAFNLSLSASVLSQTRIALNLKNASFKELIQEIEAKTDLGFIYNLDEIKDVESISLDVDNMTIEEILDSALVGSGLEYEIDRNVIIIIPKQIVPTQEVKQEKKELKGIVTDAEGNTMPGVSVVIKGTTTGVATDMDGNFNIEMPEEGGVLIFSFVGMISQEIVYAGQVSLNVTLETNSEQMDEVVVTGFFNKKKGSFTGSVLTIKAEELQQVGSTGILNTLQSIDPSFRMVENLDLGSDPNAIPDILIRGKSSLVGTSSDPTFVLDGFEVSKEKVFDLDIDNVESVTILKDASATALYGSKGANGVIVISRKRPEAGQVQFSYNSTFTVETPDLTDYDLMNTEQKLQYELKSNLYNLDDYDQNDYIDRNNELLRGVDTYWLSKPLKTALSQKQSLRIEGGGDYIRYAVDMFYKTKPGVMKDSKRDNQGVSFELSYNLNNKFLFRNILSVDKMESEASPYGNFSDYAKLNPYDRIKDDAGNYIPLLSNDVTNPLYDASLNSFDKSEYINVENKLAVDWMPNSNFKMTWELSMTDKRSNRDEFKSPYMAEYLKILEADEKGYYGHLSSKFFNYNTRIMANYAMSIGDHNLSAGLGATLREDKDEYKFIEVTGFTNDKLQNISLAQKYKEGTLPTGESNITRSVSTFGNLQYIYKDKYVVNYNHTIEGSSRFGENTRYGGFGSLGVAWNMHKESFFADKQDVFQQLKLRASIGFTGNQEFDAYQSLTRYKYDTDNIYKNGPGVYVLGLGNPDLKWEKVLKKNVGADINLLKRFAIVFNYFEEVTTDMVIPLTLPGSTGDTSFMLNYGKKEIKGFDFSLRANLIKKKDFVWSTYFTVAQEKDEILDIGNKLESFNETENLDEDGDTQRETTPFQEYYEGESTTDIKVVRSMGIDPQTGKEIYLDKNGDITYEWDAKDKVIVGNTTPDFRGTLGTNIYYKGFNFNMSFYYQLGAQRYNETLLNRVEAADPNSNVDARALDVRWENPGDHSYFTNVADWNTAPYASSRFVEDDDRLSLSNVTMSYEIRSEKLKNFKLRYLKLSLSSNNIYTWSTMKIDRGISYPFARSFTAKLTAKF